VAVKSVTVEGREYPVAPMEPELHDYPSPAFPVAVTPEVARNWLRYNYRNRNQREGGKRDYSADMQERNFAINASTISFSRPMGASEDTDVPGGKPVLMDGQHRLEACVRSNTPFVTYVAYGIDPGVRKTIDTGIKRSFHDALSMRGEKNGVVLASVIKRVHAWKNGDRHLTMKKVASTHSSLMEFFEEHPEIRRSAEVAARTHNDFHNTMGHNLRQSVIGLAHYLFMQADEVMAPEYFARVGDGDSLSLDHPVAVLRRRFVKDMTVKMQANGGTRREILRVPDWQQMCYFIRSWNAYLAWTELPEHRRVDLKNFQLVGSRDADVMPSAKSLAEVRKELKLAAEERESA
jgi:hypothetical protein